MFALIPSRFTPSGSSSVRIVWLAAWFVLSRLWQNKSVAMAAVNVAAFSLLGVGFLLTFPPFWAIFLGAR
jgi:hypothetical protein